MNSIDNKNTIPETQKIYIWSTTVRIIHFLLVINIITMFITQEAEFIPIEYHAISGYFLSGLILFRILIGLLGQSQLKFINFIYSPLAVFRYVKDNQVLRKDNKRYLGHNPIGGVGIILLILLIFMAIFTGLFLSDDLFFEAPLSSFANNQAVEILKELHEIFANFLLVAITIHILGVLYDQFILKDPIITSMITGYKPYNQNAVDIQSIEEESLLIKLKTSFFFFIAFSVPIYWIISTILNLV